MPDKDQIYFVTDADLSLLKNTFKDNDILLYAIRNVFFQWKLTEPQKNLIKMSATTELQEVLKKYLLPTPYEGFPILNVPCLTNSLAPDLARYGFEEMAPLFEAKQLEIDYLTQQFFQLNDLDAEFEKPISLFEMGQLKGKHPRKQYIDMTAYLFLMGFIDTKFRDIRITANPKEPETLEQTKERMKRDSSK